LHHHDLAKGGNVEGILEGDVDVGVVEVVGDYL